MKIFVHVLTLALTVFPSLVSSAASTALLRRLPTGSASLSPRSAIFIEADPGKEKETSEGGSPAIDLPDLPDLPGVPGAKAKEEKKKGNWKLKEAHFGDTLCPCIGFDNIEGTLAVSYAKPGFKDETKKVLYPADLGARCEKWEEGLHPDCLPGGNPGPGKGWCAQAWCFVDPCACQIPMLPQPSKYLPDTKYRGRPLYYSYAACGGKDFWEKERPEVGDPGCRCVGFDDVPGTMDIKWKDPFTKKKEIVQYPAELGGSCKSWDNDVHPLCRGDAGKRPDWCNRRWCYVDPCSCKIGKPPKVTMYLPWATFTGKSLYYSYETCGDEDSFTKTLNVEACVNQPTEDKCMGLTVRNGIQKCHWTGTNCLGAELVSHPLCEHLKNRTRQESEWGKWVKTVKGSARRAADVPALVLLMLLGVSRAAFFGQ